MSWFEGLRAQWALAADPRPSTPSQQHGVVHAGGPASTADTTANGGAGRAPGHTPGALGEYVPPKPKDGNEETTPARTGYDPATSKRIASESTESSDIYTNTDGSATRIVSSAPVNFKAKDGSWQKIDSRLVRGESGRWSVAGNSLGISVAGFPANARRLEPDGGPLGSIELGRVTLPSGGAVGWTLVGASLAEPSVTGSNATFHNVLPSTDVLLEAFHSGLKETLVLHSPDAPSSWLFTLNLTGLSVSLDEAGGIALRDGSGVTVARIPPGFMKDSKVDPRSGESPTSHAVSYELTTVDGKPALRMTADSAWLKDPARVWPVRVDPTATVTVSTSTYVQSTIQYDDVSGQSELKSGESPTVSGLYAWSLLKFPQFSSDHLGRKMSAATLRLRVFWSGNCGQVAQVTIRETTSGWSPNTVRYANPPTLGTQVAQANYDPAASVCTNNDDPNGSNNEWASFSFNGDGIGVLNGWTAGGTNHGLAVQTLYNHPGDWLKMSSVNSSYPPDIAITYTENQNPVAEEHYPNHGYASPTLTPELAVAARDPDNYPQPLTYQFSIFDPATPDNPIAQSAFTTSRSYKVPEGKLEWSKAYAWTVVISDGEGISKQVPHVLTTTVPQAPITSGLSQNADKGFSPQVGNYTTSAVDAQVAGVGPALAISRSYNSRDTRAGNAFGVGWSSVVDTRATEVTDAGSPTPRVVTVTYPTGQDVTFGRNSDGSFTAPSGRFSTLRTVTGGYELVDKEGTKYTFTVLRSPGIYGLTAITDAAGRTMSFTYTSGKLTRMSGASGRSLHLTWSGDRVATVANESGDTWGYSYSSGLLTKVCPPTSTTACHTYEYGNNSQYPTAVLDAQPHTYWRLNEPSGAPTALSSATDNTDTTIGTYNNVTLGAPGPLPAATGWTPPTAATLNGTSSYVNFSQTKVAMKRSVQSVSMWFKTASPGVLLSYQDKPLADTSSAYYNPVLYVGVDGKLRGQFWPAPSIATGGTVTNNAWHHVVLAVSGAQQQMWLDGVLVATTTGTADLSWTTNIHLGAGKWENWASTSGTFGYFNGSLAEYAFYDRPLSATQVASMYNAGAAAAKPMTKVKRPSGGTTATVEYEAASGVVKKVTDENNGVWTINPPAISGSSAVHTSAVLAAAPTDYFRLVTQSNEVNGVTGTFSSVTFDNTNAGPLGDRAAAFDGGYMTGSGSSIDTSKSYSLSSWVYLTSNAGNRQVVSLDATRGSPFRFGYDVASNKWRMLLCSGDVDNQACPGALSTSAPALSTWTHLAATVDEPTKTVKLYVNGELEATTTVPVLWKAAGPFMISRLKWNGGYTDGWRGRLADVATYQHVLTPQQIRAQYDARAKAANVAVNKAAGGAAACSGNEGPEKAVNGSITGGVYDKWCSLAASRWLQVDLGASHTVASFAVRHAGAGGETADYNTRDFTIDVSADGSNWSTVVNVTGNTADSTTHFIAGASARYARLNVVTATQIGDTAARIYEFEVYTSGGPGVPVKTVGVVDPGNKTTSYVYDLGNGERQVRQIDFRGGVTNYGYDTGGFLRTTADPNGNLTVEEHDVRGNVIAKTTCQDRSQNNCSTVYNEYFPAADVKVLTPNPLNDTLKATRDGRSSSPTDNTYRTAYEYDAQGNVISVTDPLGRVTRTDYTTAGEYIPHDYLVSGSGRYVRILGTQRGTTGTYSLRELQIFGQTGGNLALNRLTTASSSTMTPYDATDGNPMTRWASNATDSEWLYVDLLSVKAISRVRLLWSSSYGKDYQIQVSNDANSWTTIKAVTGALGTPIPTGLPLQRTASSGATHRTDYAFTGDLMMTVDASSLETFFAIDSLGRLHAKRVVASTGDQTTTYTYDKLNRVLTQTDPPVLNRITGATHTAVTTMGYDNDGNTVTQTVADSSGGDATRSASNTYNTLGQLTVTTDALQKTRTFTYDLYGNKVSETDPTGARMEYEYDAPGQLTRSIMKNWTGDPNNPSSPTDLVTEQRQYDPAGRLATVTDAMGWQTLYTYTDNGLTATITRRNPVTSATFAVESNGYDAAGNLIEKVTNNGATRETFTVDAASRATVRSLDPLGLARTTEFTYGVDDTVVRTKSFGAGAVRYVDTSYDLSGNRTSEVVSETGSGGLAGRWKLDGNPADSYGNSPGTSVGGAIAWSAERGGSAVFDGTPQQITTPGPVVDTSQSYTISAWAKLADTAGTRIVVAQWGTNGSAINLEYSSAVNRWAAISRKSDPGVSLIAASDAAPAVNTWTHLAAVYDVVAKKITLYVNGVAQASTINNIEGWRATGPFAIGEIGGQRFKGAIDDVQAYQRALSPAEITAVYNGTAPVVGPAVRSSWQLDRQGLTIASRDGNGNVTSFEYDANGQPTVTTSPSVFTEENGGTPALAMAVSTIGYNTFNEVTETKDAKGRVTTTIRDAGGQATETQMPSYLQPGSQTPIHPVAKQEYDSSGQVIKTIDPLLNETGYVYDQLGRLAKVTAPNTGVTKYTYTLNGEPLSATDANGARQETTYDYLGRKLTTTQIERSPSAAFTTAYAYNTAGLLESVTPPGRNPTLYEYNKAGEVTKVTDGAGNPVRLTYDALGRKTETIDPDNAKATATFDFAGRPSVQRRLSPTGTELSATSVSYDANGNVLSTTDPRGKTTSFVYDATGLVTQMTEPESITTSFGYDITGKPTRFTDGRTNKFVTTYNSLGLVESEIEPDGATFTTVYDAAGRALTRNEPGGVTVTNAYNTMGQLTGQTGAGADAPTAARSYGYDLAGRITSFGEGSASSTVTYNDRGLITGVTGSSGASSFTWTGDGLMASRQDASGTSTFGYDTAGRLSTVADAASADQLTFSYNNLNQATTITYGSSANRRGFGYDGLRRLTSDTLSTSGGSTIASIAYGYDANGNLTSKTTSGLAGASANTYTYDDANRLRSWNDGTTNTTYAYDASGNRTAIGSRTYTYDSRNRLTSDGNVTYTYSTRGTLTGATEGTVTTPSTFDAYGQQITQGPQTYAYDGLGRVLSASSGVSFSYSGTGNTVASDGTAVYSRGPGGNLFGVKQGTGSGLLAWTDLHTDVVAQFTSTGSTVTGSRAYNPLGVVLASTTMTGNLGYQSGWTDPGTGKVNMHARWYNPATGQFASRDSMTVSAMPTSVRANRYAYGDGNPLTATDPTGHCSFCSWVKNTVSAGVNKVAAVATTAWNTATSYVSSAYNWVSEKVSQAYNWVKEKVTQVVNWVGEKVKQVKDWAVKKFNQVKEQAKQVYGAAKQAVIEGAKRVAEAHKSAVRAVYEAAKKHAEAHVQAIKDAYKATANWIAEHKAEIAGFVVGAIVGVACGVAIGWTGVGAVACGALAGAAGSLVTGLMQGKRGWELVATTAIGGIGGLLGGGIGGFVGGKVAGLVAGKLGGGLISRVAGGMLSGAASGAAGGAAEGALGGASAYSASCRFAGGCSASGFFSAAGSGAAEGAKWGALAGGIFGGFGGLRSSKPSGCRGHSFTPDTKVLLASGAAVAIAAVKVGDEVMATDPETGKSEPKPVTALHLNRDTELTDVTVTVEGGEKTGEQVTLKTTKHHPFWDATAERWTDAADLEPGHELLVYDEAKDQLDANTDGSGQGGGGPPARVTVVKVKNYFSAKDMHDLTVADTHTYYVVVADEPVLVHNMSGACLIEGHNGEPVDIYQAETGCTCPKVIHLNPDGSPGGVKLRNEERVGIDDDIKQRADRNEAGTKAFNNLVKDLAAAHDPTLAIAAGAAGAVYKGKTWYEKVRDWWTNKRG